MLAAVVALWAGGVQEAGAQTAFERLVAERGLAADTVDRSADSLVTMAEPAFAYVNLTGFSGMPTSKSMTRRGWIEVYDGNGTYFRKPVTIAGQGGYTLKFPKRNFVCHFCDDTWNEDGGDNFVIGDWVRQDAFHFKAFYTDFIRGIAEVGYKLFDDMVADRQPYWERGGYHKASAARCYPDAFPCAVYLNGNFYGVFAWQLKKHRRNMNQKKSVAEHIHLDGNLSDAYLFRGDINWLQFEVRNPKGLYTTTGTLYDGNAPRELMDENSATYAIGDAEALEAKQLTATVKRHIRAMSNYWTELNNLEKAGTSEEDMRREVEQRYDIDGLVDYYVFHYFSQNGDGDHKNWQWFTYDGQHWTVTPYDLDQTFGLGLFGNLRPADFPITELTAGPFWWIHKYFLPDVQRRYATLRDNKTFDEDHVIALIDDWYDRVGPEFFELEKGRWPESPCYCDAICNPGWEWCDDWSLYPLVSGYSATTEYHAGDVCILEGKLWRATADVKGVKPFSRNANTDSMERIHEWVEGRIAFLDAFFSYDADHQDLPGITEDGETHRVTAIFTLDGKRVSVPVAGQVNVFKYSDGTARKVMVR